MEEDKIKELFSGYDPDISSGIAFMERLERNLNAVELIHQENSEVLKRNRIAVAMASMAGFLTGVIFTLLFPYIDSLVQTLMSTILTACSLPDSLYGVHVISWLAIGGVSAFVALNTYSLSTSLLSHRQATNG